VASDLPDRYFDLVVINDVMEHAPDHEAFLRILRTKMVLNGSLVGSVPNVRHVTNLAGLIWRKDWAYEASGGVLDETHLRFFTQKSLVRSLQTSGFSVELCEGINPIWWSRHRIRMGIKRVFYGAVGLILGSDVPYLQFAFRCKV
jgi:2-polyprenyl-3-methyl-5-hydroxy-6-metoxy-1,4-benzoquinol methylase